MAASKAAEPVDSLMGGFGDDTDDGQAGSANVDAGAGDDSLAGGFGKAPPGCAVPGCAVPWLSPGCVPAHAGALIHCNGVVGA